MKNRIFAALLAALICVVALLPMTAFAAAEEEAQKTLPQGLTIACVGDSITYGSGSANNTVKPGDKNDLQNYPGQLATLIGGTPSILGASEENTNVIFQNDTCTIYNDGKASTAVLNDPIAGEQFAKGALYVPTLVNSFARTDLDVVVLMLGTNDSKISATRASGKYEQGNWDIRFTDHDNTLGEIKNADGNTVVKPTPAQEFELRYRAILDKYLNMESQPYVYCMLPIPSLNNNVEKNYRISDENMREEINPLITSIVEDLQAEGKPVGLIDMRAQFPDPTTEEGAAELQKLLVDEVHPNSDGYKIMAETVYARLLEDTLALSYDRADADADAVIPKGATVFGSGTITIKNTRGLCTKNGVANIGWSTEPNGGGTVYEEGQEIELNTETGSITLYPVWGESPSILPIILIVVFGLILIAGLFVGGILILKKNKKA